MIGFKKNKSLIFAYLFILPCAVLLLFMMVYPALQVFQFSFSSLKLPKFDTTFIGLENFRKIFANRDFRPILTNTLIWISLSLAIRFIIGFSAALIMETGLAGKNVFRILALLPWMVPSIVTANMWRMIYNSDIGLLNDILKSINPALAHNWLGTSRLALPAVIVTYSWAGFPFIMLMLIAGIQGIPKDYYEAARIDGANAPRVFLHITLPSLRNIIAILIIMEIISGFNTFDVLYTMTAGGPGISSEIFGLFIYRTAFSNIDFAGASAASMLLIIAALVFVVLFIIVSSGRKKKGAYR